MLSMQKVRTWTGIVDTNGTTNYMINDPVAHDDSTAQCYLLYIIFTFINCLAIIYIAS